MSCEYRVMLDNLTIGLNETQLGIVAPNWFICTMQNTISKRNSELALTSGRLFKTGEALQIGLVDEIAADKNDALVKSEAFISRFARIPPLARAATKIALRGADIKVIYPSILFGGDCNELFCRHWKRTAKKIWRCLFRLSPSRRCNKG